MTRPRLERSTLQDGAVSHGKTPARAGTWMGQPCRRAPCPRGVDPDIAAGMDLDAALRAGDDAAVDDVLDVLRRDQGPWGLAEALLVVILQKQERGTKEHELNAWQYRRAAALEAAAVVDDAPPRAAAARALEAATLARDVLNDGEGATRALVLALRLSSEDDDVLQGTVKAAGGPGPSVTLLEKAAKVAKGDDALQGRLRRALARLYEVVLLDKEKAFFEALKAARKIPEGITVDDAFRLALEVKRLDDAAAFFRSLGEEVTLPARARASALNKLGAVHDVQGDKAAAFSAYVSSLGLYETKAARKKAERLKEELHRPDALPPPLVDPPGIPPPAEATASRLSVASIPPPPGDFSSADDVEPRAKALEQRVFTDERQLFLGETELSADDVVLSEELVDPALRSSAQQDDARRGPPPPPLDDDSLPGGRSPLVRTELAPGLAPPSVIEQAVLAPPPPSSRDVSDRKRAKRERKKQKARRGHGGDPLEATTPNAALDDATLPLGDSAESSLSEEGASVALPSIQVSGFGPDAPASHAGRPRPHVTLDDVVPELGESSSASGSAFDVSPPPVFHRAAAGALELTAPEQESPPPGPVAPTREDVLARAQALLQDGDVGACIEAAAALQVVIAGDPRVLRLAARALVLAAPTGALPAEGVALVLLDAVRHGERAASLIREVQHALPASSRQNYGALWLAAAQAAGHDVDSVHALLEEVADADGPDGPLFCHLDDVLKRSNDVDRRDALYLRAGRSAVGDEQRQVRLLRGRIALLEEARRDAPLLLAWAKLALEHDVDAATRLQARRAHERCASPEDRDNFLARLTTGPQLDQTWSNDGERASVLRELLELRFAVDDKMGAESTARELLTQAPGDVRATQVLADLLADDPHRAGEAVVALRARVDATRAAGDDETCRLALERLARVLTAADRKDEAIAALVEATQLAPGDQPLVERAVGLLLDSRRENDAIDLLEALSRSTPAREGALLLLRAAEIARERLQQRARARDLIEKAALLQPRDLRVVDLQAELLLEIGDAPAALTALEKLCALTPGGQGASEEKDAATRAQLHLRIGKLLEEHLQRPDDALKRYQAAVNVDKTLRVAFEALHRLARQQGRDDVVVEALTGLATLVSGREKASLLVKLGRVQQQDRNDPTAAAAAFDAALVANASDVDALLGLVSVRALALQGEHDVDAALAAPASELVAELHRPLLSAEAQGAVLPFGFRRLLALAASQDGDQEGAAARFESLLEERGDDLPTLLAFARHLALIARSRSSGAVVVAAADARRREVLEAVLLHHAYALKPLLHVETWGEVCALRLQQGDNAGAKKAAKKALALVQAAPPLSTLLASLEGALSDRAVRALVLCFDVPKGSDLDVDAADVDLLGYALTLDLQRAIAPSEQAKLKEKQALIALHHKDAKLARQLLEEALQQDPDASTAREILFDIELQGEDPRQVLEHSRALTAHERDPHKKAALHLRLFRLQKKLRLADDVAAAEIKAAVELDPKNAAILDAAEKFFAEQKDGRGLDALYTTRLKSLDRADLAARLVLLDRLAQLRRYDLRDLRAAIDACEAMSALDPDAIKPREDAARLHVELGQWKEAVYAWRAVLDRDTLLLEAWRGLFSVYARSRQADDAFAVASTMTALEIADDDMVRAVRAVRPPFPRWPLAPADVTSTKKKVAHPSERTAVRQVLEIVAPRLLPRLGRPLEDFGVRRRDALPDSKLPASVAVAVRVGAALAGFSTTATAFPLYQAELGSVDGASPPFAALPAREPGLIVTSEVLRGGMTPERAFALGRAMAWLSPWALLAASLDAAEIRRVLEGCVAAFLSPRDVEKPSAELERYGAELQKELFSGLSSTEQDALRASLAPALRDWVVGRSRLHLSDWKAAVGYTGDRLGFLLSSDLPAAVKVVRAAGGTTTAVRLAIRELVLFSISPQYLQLRKELSLALPEQALAPIIDLG